MEEAERIAQEEHGSRKISVISGKIKVPTIVVDMPSIEMVFCAACSTSGLMHDVFCSKCSSINTTSPWIMQFEALLIGQAVISLAVICNRLNTYIPLLCSACIYTVYVSIYVVDMQTCVLPVQGLCA